MRETEEKEMGPLPGIDPGFVAGENFIVKRQPCYHYTTMVYPSSIPLCPI